MLKKIGYAVKDRLGNFQARDEASGGYPYPTSDISKIHIFADKDQAELWAKPEGNTPVKVELLIREIAE
jgi:hypothetical protein